MNYIQQQISKSIAWLRFPLVIMVIFIHSGGFGPLAINTHDITAMTGMDMYNILRMLISRIICNVAVPAFFAISGYLFFTNLDKWDWNVWRGKIKKRVFTLLIPYISWNILRFLFNEFLNISQKLRHGIDFFSCLEESMSKVSPSIFCNYSITDTGYMNWNGVMTMMSVPVHVPFWYVRDLILLTLLSPAIHLTIKHLGGGITITLLLTYILMPFQDMDIRGIVFFTVGGYLSMKVKSFDNKHIEIRKRVLVLSAVVFLLSAIVNVFFLFLLPVTVLLGMVTLFIAAFYLSEKVYINDTYKNGSFFIYAFHMFCVIPIGLIYTMSHIEITNVWLLLISYLTMPFVIAALSILVYKLVMKSAILTMILLGKNIKL